MTAAAAIAVLIAGHLDSREAGAVVFGTPILDADDPVGPVSCDVPPMTLVAGLIAGSTAEPAKAAGIANASAALAAATTTDRRDITPAEGSGDERRAVPSFERAHSHRLAARRSSYAATHHREARAKGRSSEASSRAARSAATATFASAIFVLNRHSGSTHRGCASH